MHSRVAVIFGVQITNCRDKSFIVLIVLNSLNYEPSFLIRPNASLIQQIASLAPLAIGEHLAFCGDKTDATEDTERHVSA